MKCLFLSWTKRLQRCLPYQSKISTSNRKWAARRHVRYNAFIKYHTHHRSSITVRQKQSYTWCILIKRNLHLVIDT